MTYLKYLLAFFILSMAWCACDDEMENPGYSEIPHITFEDIEVSDGQYFDTIKITISYRDGDADLGLNGNEIDSPYHRFDPVTTKYGHYIHFSEDWNDTLPEYNCRQWIYFQHVNYDTIRDTILIKRNKYHDNYHVDWYFKKGNKFEPFDFINELCLEDIDSRFPIIASNKKVLDDGGPFKVVQKSRWEGTIIFRVPYAKSFAGFPSDTLKFRIHINDRALNESNIIETDEIVLP